MSGLDRFVAFDKGEFIGADGRAREREDGAAQLLVLLEVDAADADASTDEGIWLEGRRVGFVTSGAYGHHVGKSLALAYVDATSSRRPELTVSSSARSGPRGSCPSSRTTRRAASSATSRRWGRSDRRSVNAA